MFKRKESIPHRTKFCITREDLISDIEAVYQNEEQRSKLYFCLDETPPKEHRFEKIEEFLKGTQDLERMSNALESLKCEMEHLQKDITHRINAIKTTADSHLNK